MTVKKKGERERDFDPLPGSNGGEMLQGNYPN